MACARRSKNDELYEKRKQLTDLLEAARVEKEEVSALAVVRCTVTRSKAPHTPHPRIAAGA
jgi:hypothetical protein